MQKRSFQRIFFHPSLQVTVFWQVLRSTLGIDLVIRNLERWSPIQVDLEGYFWFSCSCCSPCFSWPRPLDLFIFSLSAVLRIPNTCCFSFYIPVFFQISFISSSQLSRPPRVREHNIYSCLHSVFNIKLLPGKILFFKLNLSLRC